MGFPAFWDFKPSNGFHSDGHGVCTSDKILNLVAIGKIHLKCDCIDGSVVNGVRESLLLCFVLGKPAGYKIFCEPETIQYEKINKSVLNTATFYLEDDYDDEIDFNGETLTFGLQTIKI